jgi:DUF1680 family protein
MKNTGRKFSFFVLLYFFKLIEIFAQDKLQAFNLNDVRLLEGPFKTAQQTDFKYLMALDADRLLAPYLKEAGIAPKAKQYPNWENTGLDGHMAGHYLSALSLMFAASGDIKIKQKLHYVIDELNQCQQKNGDGYLGGVPAGKAMWAQIKQGNIKSSSFSLNGKWVPLYNLHKIYSGLYDAYTLTRNQKAKNILIKLTDWCIELTSNLSDTQIQTLLNSEHGGLNEVFANVYGLTGDKKYLLLARKFSDLALLNPLLKNQDALNGLHANTQIPKVVGFAQIAKLDNDLALAKAADFFWQTVVHNRTLVIGGNSVREHFNPISNFSSLIESREGPETCNSYNMLKLTKQLFLANASGGYIDYYERTLYNHILPSQSKNGGFAYFTPMRPGHYRIYSNPQESFWCCVGSGLENHAKYGELIYAHNQSNLFVNLYIPSQLNWYDKGLQLTQQTFFPNTENAKVILKLKKPNRFTIFFRQPNWVSKGKMQLFVNGKKQALLKNADGYLAVSRLWKTGDVVNVKLPMHTSTEFMPDKSDWLAFVHGPIVLAAEIDTLMPKKLIADASRMGHIADETLFPLDKAPLIVGSKNSLATQIIPLKTGGMHFTASELIYYPRYKNLKLVPFYTLADKRYIVYWPYSNADDLQGKLTTLRKIENERNKLDSLTLDVVNTGEQQPEKEHNFMGEKTNNGTFLDRHFRNGNGWFSYQFKNQGLQATKLRLILHSVEKTKNFDVFIGNTLLANVTVDAAKEGFYEEDLNVPVHLQSENLDVKFMAKPKSTIPNIYEVRLMK